MSAKGFIQTATAIKMCINMLNQIDNVMKRLRNYVCLKNEYVKLKSEIIPETRRQYRHMMPLHVDYVDRILNEMLKLGDYQVKKCRIRLARASSA